MGLLNYSTSIKTEDTVAEIEKILSENGANRILKEFDKSKNISAITFMIDMGEGIIPFRLPINVKAVMQVINEQTEIFKVRRGTKSRVVPLKFKHDMGQATRVGWRIIKDWVEAQMALVQLKQAKIQEVFLPYAVGKNGQTLYQQIENSKFNMFLLEPPK